MENFVFRNPTKIVFGKGQIAHLARELPADARILLTYGGGSIMANGVYAQTKAALGDRTVFELSGIEPNPRYETLMRGVALVKEHKLDYLLSVGGGSVLDGTKFIAAAVPFTEGDPWRILSENAEVKSALPIGAVLTLPATGSESNGAAVISRDDQKLAFINPLVYPVFSILDPETTFTLPPRQIANGVIDSFVHVMEQYMTYPAAAPLQDRFAESLLQTLIEIGPQLMAKPGDYDLHATFMWTATLALNGLIGAGVPQDWATHIIGHELTALHGTDHARTLAVVLPSLLDVQRVGKREKLLQWAERVWGVREGTPEERIDAAIARMRAFFESLGVPTRLSGHGIPDTVAAVVEQRLAARKVDAIGERGDITPAVVRRILAAAA
ncbi:iron-containing alcohol dehydrogenase [Opitutales bacterium ASA1]|uniref:iron-containing alcohol dehydrogenase n=1 Tax=Congregicoccus parvus TaxID=3081749 RepID=UPI002B2EF118|nr:iron-containing alcohol dehydrogenase [Opitutales bacterium ASA1]